MKCLLLLAFVAPLYLAFVDAESIDLLYCLQNSEQVVSKPFVIYVVFIYSSLLWLGLPWIHARPLLKNGWLRSPVQTRIVNVADEIETQLPLTDRCKWFSRVPFNQIFELAIEKIELPVNGLPDRFDGYRIAHLSDVHLTGDVSPQFTRYALGIAEQWGPELLALTGDVIDSEDCVDWLEGIFSRVKVNDGAYFILGNHDARMPTVSPIRSAMEKAGWKDLGGKVITAELRQQDVTLIGSEAPWLEMPRSLNSEDQTFRILLSHSPDQIRWAQKNHIQLMLAGHTHGGQGRLPLLGPVLSPSVYGSRFASGQFYRSPTTLHVTRGLSGTRLLRLNCRPELSLLTLRQA
ncbi:MAG: metallophosphoesterase [Rubripirellula sp.]|nr:metallophosphoesterase [Rubripirellula sp.]